MSLQCCWFRERFITFVTSSSCVTVTHAGKNCLLEQIVKMNCSRISMRLLYSLDESFVEFKGSFMKLKFIEELPLQKIWLLKMCLNMQRKKIQWMKLIRNLLKLLITNQFYGLLSYEFLNEISDEMFYCIRYICGQS